MSQQVIRVGLRDDEIKALTHLAESEFRPISMQAQRIIIEALRERHLLPVPKETRQAAAVPDAA